MSTGSGSSGKGRTGYTDRNDSAGRARPGITLPSDWGEQGNSASSGSDDVLENLYFGRDMSSARYGSSSRASQDGASYRYQNRSASSGSSVNSGYGGAGTSDREYTPRYMHRTTSSVSRYAEKVQEEAYREEREEERPRKKRSSSKKNSKKRQRAIWRRRIVIGILSAMLLLAILIITGLVRVGLAIHNRTPEVTLNGEPEMTVFLGEKFEDPGATGTLKDERMNFFNGKKRPTVTGEVNTSVEGTYHLTYTVKYHDKEAKAGRDVTVVERDLVPPEITLEGGDEVTIFTGSTFEDGYSAYDTRDGDLTGNVEVLGTVDTSTPATYQLTYRVADAQGNMGTKTRNVIVKLHPEQDPDAKIIYLTFDDGPYKYTERLLDILDAYDVKATFFVTAQFPDYIDMIGEEYRRGHAIGIHSLTHEFNEVYASDDAFWQDHDAMQEIVVEQTGHETRLMRFIGGSSNTISAKYSDGIMSRLVEQAEERGYIYFDWNVTSGDGGDTTITDEVVNNIINECSGQKVSVVLCHDIKDFTVDGIERVLKWGKENGYTFLPLNESSYAPHHGVNN